MFADRLAAKFKKSKKCQCLYAEDTEFIVVKPQTYMNMSGLAVRCILDSVGADTEKLLIVCDDFNLPLGRLRMRPWGSAGGHNGLKSIIDSLGTEKFARLRLGIDGVDMPDKTEYVLENFNKREFKIIEDMLIDARSIIKCYISNGIDDTMNKFNG